MLIVCDEALAVLLGANCGGVSLQIVDVSVSSLWKMVCVEFPRIVKLLLSMVVS